MALSLILLWSSLSWAARPTDPPAAFATDTILDRMAAGEPAARALESRLATATEPLERAALGCLLGRAWVAEGRPDRALTALSEVPTSAPCGRRASFDRADLLLRDDPAAAAKLYGQLAEERLGPHRHLALLRHFDAAAEQLAQAASPEHALPIRIASLDLALPEEERYQRALTLAKRPEVLPNSARSVLTQILLRRLHQYTQSTMEGVDTDHLRRTLIGLLDGAGWVLLPMLALEGANAPDNHHAWAQVAAARGDLATAIDHLGAAKTGEEGEEEADRRLLLARRLSEAGDPQRAVDALEPLPEHRANEALRLRATLNETLAHQAPEAEAAAKAFAAADADLSAWIARFPTHPDRAAVEAERQSIRLTAAEILPPILQVAQFERLEVLDPTQAPAYRLAAADALRRGGDPAGALRRYEALLAATPFDPAAAGALRGLISLRLSDPQGASNVLPYLRGLARNPGPFTEAAADLLHTLETPHFRLDAPADGQGVRVLARNLQQLRVRLHRIDPEAFLRAGGTAETLPELDVGVIAPDHTFVQTLPAPAAPGLSVAPTELDLPRLGAGLYMVTASSDSEEATVFRAISTTRLLARARGPHLAVVVLDGERPVGGAPVWIRADGEVRSYRTDSQGLLRVRVDAPAATILTEPRSGPALLTLDWPGGSAPTPARALIDLDQPYYLSGDRVQFRVAYEAPIDSDQFVTGAAAAPFPSRVEVAVHAGNRVVARTTLALNQLGTAQGELPLPARLSGSAILVVQDPANPDHPLARLALPMAEAAPHGTWTQKATAKAITLADADGLPVAGRTLLLEDPYAPGARPVGPTGPDGRFAPDLPTLPGTVRLGLPGAQVQFARSPQASYPAGFWDGTLQAEGLDAGPVRVQAWALSKHPAPWKDVTKSEEPDLFLDSPDSLTGHAVWDDPEQPQPSGAATLDLRTDWKGEGAIPLPSTLAVANTFLPPNGALPEQPFLLMLSCPDLRCAPTTILPSLDPRGILPASPLRTDSERTATPTPAGPVLETWETRQGLLAARILHEGKTPPTARLPGVDGQVARHRVDARGPHVPLPVNREVDLTLELSHSGPTGAHLRLRGPDGRPRGGEVAVRWVDPQFHRWGGSSPMQAEMELQGRSAAVGGLAMSRAATPIAAALRAEEARERATARREAAAAGALSGGLLDDQISAGTITGLGGIGTSGRGGGGGGYGSGAGTSSGGQQGGAGTARPRVDAAALERGAFAVFPVGPTGELDIELPPGLSPDLRWEVRALSRDPDGAMRAGFGHLDPKPTQPRLIVNHLSPANPGDLAERVAHVHNPTERTFEGRLVGPDAERVVHLAPGAAASFSFGLAKPDTTAHFRLIGPGGEPIAEQGLDFSLALPTVPDPDGDLVLAVAGDPRTVALSLYRSDAWAHTTGALPSIGALAARAAQILLLWPDLSEPERATLAGLLLTLREVPNVDAETRARTLTVLGMAAALGPSYPHAPTQGELEAHAAALHTAVRSSADRAFELEARAAAGLSLDPSSLARLRRDAASLPPAALRALERAQGKPAGAPDLPGAANSWDRVELIRSLLAEAPAAGTPAAGSGPSRGHAGRNPPIAPLRLQVPGSEPIHLSPGEAGLRVVHVPNKAPLTIEGMGKVWRGRATRNEAGTPLLAGRVPRGNGLSPRPLTPWAAHPTQPGTSPCGINWENPCQLAPGDGIAVRWSAMPATPAPGGLQYEAGGIRALTAGQYTVGELVDPQTGLPAAPLHLSVRADLPLGVGLAPSEALIAAREAVTLGQDPRPYLNQFAHFDDWPADLRPSVMALRWELSAAAPPAERLAAFEDLRDASPAQTLPLEDLHRIAQDLEAVGQPGRAVAVWRVALGAAFQSEVARFQDLEPHLGPLRVLQTLRALPMEHPTVSAVETLAYQLPSRVAALAERGDLADLGLDPVDSTIAAAAWGREFLAIYPDSAHAPAATLELALQLMGLRAHGPAAAVASRGRTRFNTAPLADALTLTEAQAQAALGAESRARQLLSAVALSADWPQAGGARGPSALAVDARHALARLDEASGRYAAAREAYQTVEAQLPEAGLARTALERVVLEVPTLHSVGENDPLRVPVLARNVDTLELRAYAVDLRTLFLRDPETFRDASALRIGGVSPVWAGQRRLGVGPFEAETSLDLPLRGPGAWLIEATGPGVEARFFVMRSGLRLTVDDGAPGRRVAVHARGQPAVGLHVRAWTGGTHLAAETDARGVVVVPAGADVLVFSDTEVAFITTDSTASTGRPARGGAAPAAVPDMRKRLQEQRRVDEADFQRLFQGDRLDAVEAGSL